MHSSIRLISIPIGILSEKNQEAGNEFYIEFKPRNTRKTSRIYINTDRLHTFLISSNPFVTFKNIPTIIKKKDELHSKAMNLLNYNIKTCIFEDFELDSSSSFTENLKSDSSSRFANIDNDSS